MAKNDKQTELYNFMLNKLGGEKAVMTEFHKTRLYEVINKDPTLTELLETATNEGWGAWLSSLNVSTLTGSEKPSKTAKKAGTRMTQDEVAKMQTDIVAFLKGHPGSKVGDVAKAVGGEAGKIGVQLKKLIGKTVEATGKKAKTTYTLK
jgi:hypothetical protein